MSKIRKEKILVIKISAVGDVVMALPLLNKLKSEHPQALIHWVCGNKVEKLIRATQLVDKITTVDEEKLLKGPRIQKILQVLKVWWHLGLRYYDRCLVLHSDKRYQLFVILTRFKRDILSKRKFPISGRYQAIEMLRLYEGEKPCQKLDFTFPMLRYTPSFQADQFVKQINPSFVLFAPGGNPRKEPGKELRMWPIHSYVELAKLFNDDGIQVVIAGGESDAWMEKYFQRLNVVSFIGKGDLLDFLTFAKEARCVITHDSGPMHLALLSGGKCFAIFGPTNPYEKLPILYEKYANQVRFSWRGENLQCRPCYDGKSYAPCRNPLCMKQTIPQEVFSECMEWIDA